MKERPAQIAGQADPSVFFWVVIGALLVGILFGLIIWTQRDGKSTRLVEQATKPAEPVAEPEQDASTGSTEPNREVSIPPAIKEQLSFSSLIATRWYFTPAAQREIDEDTPRYYHTPFNVEKTINERIPGQEIWFAGDDGLTTVLCFSVHYVYNTWEVRAYISTEDEILWRTTQKDFKEFNDAIDWMINEYVAAWNKVGKSLHLEKR